jgi:penicillin-binding protein 1A
MNPEKGVMKEFLKKLVNGLKGWYIRAYRWAWPHILKVKPWYDKAALYLNNHPKIKWAAMILSPPFALFVLILLIVWIETPWNSELRNIRNQVASEVYSADSVLLGRYYIQDRTEVEYKDIAPSVINALIATEDVRFYQHSGVDYKSLGRVLIKSIIQQDESSGGGSTITQQLSKNLYPRKRYWIFPMLINKLREFRTALKLEDIYSKEELVTMYLNTVPFADNVFGIEAAAERFYSVKAKALSIDQAAVLVGMLKATHNYNPRLFPDRSLKRRNVVLSRMVRYNYLDRAKADSISKLPLELEYNKISHHQGLAPYFREYLKAELLTWCKNNEREDGSNYNLYTDGLKIYTTIDSRLQEYAENAVSEKMTEIQKSFFSHWGKDKPWKGKEEVLEQAIQRSTRYKRLQEQGLSEDEILIELQKPIPMTLFSWEGAKDAVVSPIDSIIHHLQYLNAGFLAMEPATGQIKAWVGGIDHDFFQYDHVNVATKRQVGSIFKPIVYAMAVEEGVPPCEMISASQQTYIDKEGEKWTPRDTQNDYEVEYSMRGALAYSINTVAVKLIQRAGVDKTIALAKSMGVVSEVPDVPSIALGSTSISLMEMTNVYACFANQSVTVTPYYINRVEDSEGKVFDNFKPKEKGKRVLSEETSALMIQMLRGVVNEGTAAKLRSQYGIHNDVAGKTGTTQSNADGWFMAMTPHLVIGTWVGADDPRIRFRFTELGQGSSTALPITAAFLAQVNKDKKYKSITEAKFASLPPSMQQEMNCEVYYLNDSLVKKIERSIFQRDSIIHADTTAKAPPETFLQVLYKRKLRRVEAKQKRDSLAGISETIPDF